MPSTKDLKLFFIDKMIPASVDIRANVITIEGYNYENLSDVLRNLILSILRASKISLLVIVIVV